MVDRDYKTVVGHKRFYSDNTTLKLRESIMTYGNPAYISIDKLSFFNQFYNISDTLSNNIFSYYDSNNTLHEITFENGSYDVVDIDNVLKKDQINNGFTDVVEDIETPKIKLEVDSIKYAVKMIIAPSFSVNFTENSFYNILGFESKIYLSGIYYSALPTKINPVNKILIKSRQCVRGIDVQEEDFSTGNDKIINDVIAVMDVNTYAGAYFQYDVYNRNQDFIDFIELKTNTVLESVNITLVNENNVAIDLGNEPFDISYRIKY